MRLALLGFSRRGTKLCRQLAESLKNKEHVCEVYALKTYREQDTIPVKDSVSQWTKEQFARCDGLIFVGAVGIAVRLIAPYVKDKSRDPAVVVIDERGNFTIPLLSGHLGGANALAQKAALIIGGIPVITTATDINHKFAVDLYAKEQGLWISDMGLAKQISADILDERPVGFLHDFSREPIPEGTVPGNQRERNIRVTICDRLQEENQVLRLVAPLTVLGIGCRKGCEEEKIRDLVEISLARQNISVKSISAIGTIDLKAGEPGLVSFAESLGIPLYPFTPAELMEQQGEFTTSEFVRNTTGVDNVCERAAMAVCRGSGGGRLVLRKQKMDGVTVAIAVKQWKADK